MKILQNRRTVIIVGIIAIVLLVGGIFLYQRRVAQQGQNEDVFQNEEVIPTVDSSVKVELKPYGTNKSIATLTVRSAPAGTKSINYEVTYKSESTGGFSDEGLSGDVPQGAIGKCEKTGNTWECGNKEPISQGRRVIVFGTSSSGVYKFHKVIGKVRVTLIFEGSYGKRIFDKEFKI